MSYDNTRAPRVYDAPESYAVCTRGLLGRVTAQAVQAVAKGGGFQRAAKFESRNEMSNFFHGLTRRRGVIV